MTGIDHMVIVVPAHNEQRRIPAAIASINAARDRLHGSVATTLVVVADACRDRTARCAAELLRVSDLVIEVDFRSVGSARAVGVAAGLATIDVDVRSVWVANTDADSTVPSSWLCDQLRIAEQGVDAVAGIVELDPSDGTVMLAEQFARAYTVDPNGSHSHVHGANLGVRASAYADAGGWSPLSTGEDHDLWNRLRAVGAHTISSTSLTVTTSARRRGRATKGFARDLARLQRSAA